MAFIDQGVYFFLIQMQIARYLLHVHENIGLFF